MRHYSTRRDGLRKRGLILNLPRLPVWVQIVRVPYLILCPRILLVCVIGSDSLNNSVGDVLIMAIFGVIGFRPSKAERGSVDARIGAPSETTAGPIVQEDAGVRDDFDTTERVREARDERDHVESGGRRIIFPFCNV